MAGSARANSATAHPAAAKGPFPTTASLMETPSGYLGLEEVVNPQRASRLTLSSPEATWAAPTPSWECWERDWLLQHLTFRIMEWFRVEWTFQSHPVHERGHLQPDQVAQRPGQPDLEHLQGFTTLSEKYSFLVSNLNLPSSSLFQFKTISPCPTSLGQKSLHLSPKVSLAPSPG